MSIHIRTSSFSFSIGIMGETHGYGSSTSSMMSASLSSFNFLATFSSKGIGTLLYGGTTGFIVLSIGIWRVTPLNLGKTAGVLFSTVLIWKPIWSIPNSIAVALPNRSRDPFDDVDSRFFIFFTH